MVTANASGYQEGFVEIAQEQLDALRNELGQMDEAIDALEGKLGAARRDREAVIQRMAKLEALFTDAPVSELTTNVHPKSRQTVVTADKDSVHALIKERGGPMHYVDIHKTLVERGYKVGGQGTADTLLARFFRDPRLVRVDRGTYDLAERHPGSLSNELESTKGTARTRTVPNALKPSKRVTVVEKAALTLRTAGTPLHYREITRRLMDSGAWVSDSKTPEATISSRVASDIKENGDNSTFVRVGLGVYALREWEVVQ